MLEHVQMLRDGRQADIVRARELAHDRVTAGKLFEDRSPDRMGQRREHGVELLSDHGSINHLVNRMVAGYSTIWLTDIFRTTRCRRFCRNASTKIEDLMWEATQESNRSVRCSTSTLSNAIIDIDFSTENVRYRRPVARGRWAIWRMRHLRTRQKSRERPTTR